MSAATVLELTRTLVAIPSVNPDLEAGGAGEAVVAETAAEWLASWGFAVERIDAAGRPSVVARLRRGPGPCLVLNGHLDTVGVAGMTVDPFAGEVRDGRLYGRGACDMKGGLAALLAAARDVAAADGGGELVVALTADEEHASVGMQAVTDAGVRGDAAVVCEPTELAIMPAHKGFAWIEVLFRGRAAHGSRPEQGVDAIRHAGHLLARLGELDTELAGGPTHPLLAGRSIHAGTIEGGSMPSVYPAECRLVLERRMMPGETGAAAGAEVEALVDALRPAIPELDASVKVTLERPGTEVARDVEPVPSLTAALEAEGLEPRVEGMTAWVDAALLNLAGVPAVCFGPGSIAQAHTAGEYVVVDELEAAHRVLRRFALRFLDGGG